MHHGSGQEEKQEEKYDYRIGEGRSPRSKERTSSRGSKGIHNLERKSLGIKGEAKEKARTRAKPKLKGFDKTVQLGINNYLVGAQTKESSRELSDQQNFSPSNNKTHLIKI